jgi:hypothetical protein
MRRVLGVLFGAVLSCDGTEPAKPTEAGVYSFLWGSRKRYR